MTSPRTSEKMILIGNPGTGKSSTINCYLGKHLFKSGPALSGVGVTYELDCREHEGKYYMDTPGLSDVKLRRAAADAIDQALQKGGNFNIIFAMTTESGRLKADDLTTMKLVFEAANQIGENQYAIFINKCKKRWLNKFDRGAFIEQLHSAMSERNIPLTYYIHFAPEIEELDEMDDELASLDEETYLFFENAPTLEVETEFLNPVDASSFEQIKEEFENKLAEAETARKAAEAKAEAEEHARRQAEIDRQRAEVAKRNAEIEKQRAVIDKQAADSAAAQATREKEQAKRDKESAECAAARAAREKEQADREKESAKEQAATAKKESARLLEEIINKPKDTLLVEAPFGWAWLTGTYTLCAGEMDGQPYWEQQTNPGIAGWTPNGSYYRLRSRAGRWIFEPYTSWVDVYPDKLSNSLHHGRKPYDLTFGSDIKIK